MNVECRSSAVRKKRGTSSRMSNEGDIAMAFNPLRFLAMNLKSQNDTLMDKARTAGNNTPPSTSGANAL